MLSVNFFIPHNVPSLKNDRIVTKFGSFQGKTVKEYLKKFNIRSMDVNKNMYERVTVYKNKNNLFYREFFKYFNSLKEHPNFNYPIICKMHFVRGNNQRFDFNNMSQMIADMFTAHSFIKDDNMDFFLPIPLKMDNKWYSVDKDNPGVFIQLIVPN